MASPDTTPLPIDPDPNAADTGTGDTEDTALQAPKSCISDAIFERSAYIQTVFTVRWRCDAADEGGVAFGIGEEELDVATATRSEDGVWMAVVLGLPAGTEGWLQIWHPNDASETWRVKTGPALDQLPTLDEQSGEGSGYVLTTTRKMAERNHIPAIFDAQGRPVWWHVLGGPHHPFSSRLRMTKNNRWLYYNVYNVDISPTEEDFAGLVKISLDGATVEKIPLPDNHHDFWLHDDGTIAYLSYDIRTIDGRLVAGDRLVILSEEGRTTLWSTWDHLTYTPGGPTSPAGELWSIANSLRYDATRGAYWIGFRELDILACIDEKTGETLFIFGGPGSDLPLKEEEAFHGQHGFSILDKGVLLFDNRRHAEDYSRVVRYALDEELGVAYQEWEHSAEESRYTPYYGDVMPLSDGEYLILWGEAGLIERINLRGEALHSLHFASSGLGFASYRERLVP